MTPSITIARPALFTVAAGLFALTAPAVAAPVDDALPQGTLNIAGTDFTSAKAVDHLKARVRRMAYQICVPDGSSRLPIPTDQSKCVDTAISNGLAQIAGKQEQALRAITVTVAAAQIDTHPAR